MMKDRETVVPGIGRGGMTDKYQIKILICYLMSVVESPFTKEQLHEIFADGQVVNYFSFCEAIEELAESHHIEKQSDEESGVYTLNPLGAETARRLSRSLPKSIRDNVVQTAMQLLAKKKYERENEVQITPITNGFSVTCTIHDTSFDLMQLTLYAPDRMQAELIRHNFLKDPVTLYQNTIELLTDS